MRQKNDLYAFMYFKDIEVAPPQYGFLKKTQNIKTAYLGLFEIDDMLPAWIKTCRQEESSWGFSNISNYSNHTLNW